MDLVSRRVLSLETGTIISTKPTKMATSPSLFDLLDLDCNSVEERLKLNIRAVRDIIRRDPSAAATQYKFDSVGGENLYPIFMAVWLAAPVDIIRNLYTACPKALGETTSGGWTPLHLAARSGAEPAVIDFLLQRCPSHAARKNKLWYTPLHVACMFEASVDVVRRLVTRYPKGLSERDQRGCVPLHSACLFGASFEVIRLLVAMRRSALLEKNVNGHTPLHAACGKRASLEIIQLLVTKGQRACGEKDARQCTPLHHSVRNQSSKEVVRLLLESHLMNVIETTNEGKSVLEIAQMTGSSLEVCRTIESAAELACLGADSDDDAAALLDTMSDLNWHNGADMVLYAHPALVHKIHLDCEVVPSLLEKVGSDNQLQAMFAIVTGMTNLLLS